MSSVDFSGTRNLAAKFATWRGGFSTPNGLALMGTIELAAREGNRDGLMAGTDRDSQGMAPLKPSTLARRDGTGPPLIPQDEAAVLISQYRADHFFFGPYRVVIECGWRGVEWLKYHARGPAHNPRLPIRDVTGIRPATHARIKDQIRSFVRGSFTMRAPAGFAANTFRANT